MRTTLLLIFSQNHSAPSGPVVIPQRSLRPPGTLNSLNSPFVLILSTTVGPPPCFPTAVNQTAPSGPAVIWFGITWPGIFFEGTGYSENFPFVVTRPIRLFGSGSTNQRARRDEPQGQGRQPEGVRIQDVWHFSAGALSCDGRPADAGNDPQILVRSEVLLQESRNVEEVE